MVVLQIAEGIPNPQDITDTLTALKWVIGLLMVTIIAMAGAIKFLWSAQRKNYEAQIEYLTKAVNEKDEEIKELNGKVIDNIVPCIQSLDKTLDKLLEQGRK